jgi:RimJ/RimL family protein N-acetyltransferase
MSRGSESFDLTPADAPELSRLLLAARPKYLAHFHPFPFDAPSLETRLRARRLDQYFALRCDGALAGFWMLRGLDEGYTRPAFGVFVAEEFAGRGLATRALRESIAWCRAHGIARLMLKVHPENIRARRTYDRAGFRFSEICSRTQHEILELALTPEPSLDPAAS